MPVVQPLQFLDRQPCYMSPTCVALLVVRRGYYRDETPCIYMIRSQPESINRIAAILVSIEEGTNFKSPGEDDNKNKYLTWSKCHVGRNSLLGSQIGIFLILTKNIIKLFIKEIIFINVIFVEKLATSPGNRTRVLWMPICFISYTNH